MKSSARVDILLEKEQIALLKKLSREQDTADFFFTHKEFMS